MRNPFRRRHSLVDLTDDTTLIFPTHLETAEQTIARMGREQAAYVSKHWTRR